MLDSVPNKSLNPAASGITVRISQNPKNLTIKGKDGSGSGNSASPLHPSALLSPNALKSSFFKR